MNRFILQVSLRELNRWCLEEFDFGLDAYSCPKEFLRAMIDLTPRELLLHVAHLLIEEKIEPARLCVVVEDGRVGGNYLLSSPAHFPLPRKK